MYIYRSEGWGDGPVVMGLIAVLSNLPGTSWHKSYAYNAANYYIGKIRLLVIACVHVYTWLYLPCISSQHNHAK